MKHKLTVHSVEKLKAPDPSGRQQLYWDTDLTGFGVLCSGATNAKSYIVQADLPGGITRRLTVGKTNVVSLKAAREAAKAKLADMMRGVDPKAKTHKTLAAALDAYLEGNPQLRPKSVHDYRSSIEGHLAKWLNLPLAAITADMVAKRHHQITGEATANGVFRVFRAIWNFASDEPNPTRRLKWHKVARRTRHLTVDQLPKFFKAVRVLPSPIAADYLTLLLFTGLRREEAASLTWKDVDFDARVIRISGDKTKNGQALNLPMTDFVVELLKGRPGRERYVFPSNSAAGYIAEPKFPLTQVRLATGIKVSPHDLRRTFATVAADCGVRHNVLKLLLNHAPSRDVTDGYTIVSPGILATEAQRVCDRLKALCGGG
jgi:integrase